MKPLLLKLEALFKPYSTITLVFLFFWLVLANRCSNASLKRANKKQTEVLLERIETLERRNSILYRIESLRMSKRLVYDENSIVRTKQRPDDVMAAYDEEIQKLQEELSKSSK